MVKLSKKVLARRKIRDEFGPLYADYFASYKLSDLVERYGADATLQFNYDGDYYDESVNGLIFYREREETDEEYDARIKAETKKQKAAAKARAENKERREREARERAERAERDERALYLKLRKKFGDK